MSGTKTGSGVNVSADVAAIKTSTDDWLDDASCLFMGIDK